MLVSALFGSMLWISSYEGEWLEWHNEDPHYVELTKGLDEAAKDKLLWKEGIKNIRDNPVQYLKFCFKYLWRFWICGHSNTFYGLRDSLKNYFSAGAYGKVIIKVSFLIFNTLLIVLGGCGIISAIRKLRNKREKCCF